MSRKRVWSVVPIGLTVCALLMSTGVQTALGAVGGSTTFFVSIGDNCVYGQTADPNQSFRVTVKNPDGMNKDRQQVQSDIDGSWQMCLSGTHLDIGDRISTFGLANDRNFDVPLLTIATDRVTNKVSGIAPANTDVYISARHCDINGCNTKDKTINSGASGTYSTRFNPLNPRGGDQAWADLYLSGGDGVEVYASFQSMHIYLGTDWGNDQGSFDGYASEGFNAQLTLKTAGTTRASVNATGDRWGYFYGRFHSGNTPVYARPGDKITSNIATDAKMVVPNIGPVANVTANRIAGKCFAGQQVYVEAYDPTGNRPDGYSSRSAAASSSGSFSLKMNVADGDPAFQLMFGDHVNVVCTDKAGDQVSRGITVRNALTAPGGVSGTGDPINYKVQFGYTGSFSASPRGLIAADTQPGAVDENSTATFEIAVPSGMSYARFAIFDDATDNPGGYDLDMCVYRDPLGDDEQVGCSTSGTATEQVSVANPQADTYEVDIYADYTGGVTANFTLFDWLLGTTDAGNMAVAAPASATRGAKRHITLSFSGLAPDTRYLGSVAYSGIAGLPDPTIVYVQTAP